MLAGKADNIGVSKVNVVILGPVCRQAGFDLWFHSVQRNGFPVKTCGYDREK